MIYAPFTPEQVLALNRWQAAAYLHPFTCGNGCRVSLVATPEGWRCPLCEYTQNWAHPFMITHFDPSVALAKPTMHQRYLHTDQDGTSREVWWEYGGHKYVSQLEAEDARDAALIATERERCARIVEEAGREGLAARLRSGV